MPVWACVFASFTHAWGYYTLLTGITQYMKDILKFDIATVSSTVTSVIWSRSRSTEHECLKLARSSADMLDMNLSVSQACKVKVI